MVGNKSNILSVHTATISRQRGRALGASGTPSQTQRAQPWKPGVYWQAASRRREVQVTSASQGPYLNTGTSALIGKILDKTKSSRSSHWGGSCLRATSLPRQTLPPAPSLLF